MACEPGPAGRRNGRKVNGSQVARMPTAAKLVAAFSFAFLAFMAAEIFKPHMPDGTQFGAFSPVSALIGLLAGWKVMGAMAGQGWVQAINNGVRTSLTIVVLALVIFSIEEMIQVAMRKLYDGPGDAILGAFKLAADFSMMLLAPDMLILLLVGGALGGLFTEWTARRWK